MKRILLFILVFVTFRLLSAQTHITRKTYIYSIKGADTLRLDTYIDDTAAVKGKRPVMIYVHGGGFSMGSRKNVAQEIFNRHFAEKGFISVSIDYRLALSQPTPNSASTSSTADKKKSNRYNIATLYDAVRIADEDVVDATNFILSKANEWKVDSTCIMISGGSAGAITCLTLEYDLCNHAPYTQKLPEGFNYAGIVSQAGAICLHKEKALTWERKPCPILFFHGDKDSLVPIEHKVIAGEHWFGDKMILPDMRKMHVSYWSFVEKGADHIMAMKPLTDNNAETDKFVDEMVKGKKQAYVYTEWAEETAPDMSSAEHMLKYVPMYILGFGKYIDEMDWSNIPKPTGIVY